MNYFHEEQSWRSWWVWTLLAAAGIPILFVLIENLVRPVPVLPSLLSVGISIPIALLFFASRLIVDVTADEIRIDFHFLWPMQHIPIGDVRRAHETEYNSLLQYGGWGVRYAFVRGWAFNTGGSDGVLVETNGGKRVMIGSRRAKELEAAIAHAIADRAGR